MTRAPTYDDVRRKIAELLGWRDLRIGPYLVHDAPAEGDLPTALMGYTPDGAWQHVPDWTADSGAALALCLDVLDRLNARDAAELWELIFEVDCVAYRRFDTAPPEMAAPFRNAFSMAALALKGLERLAALEAEARP